jgi:hypothetical protein
MTLNEHYEAVLADLQQMKADAEDGIRAIKRLMTRPAGSVGTQVTKPSANVQPEDNGTPQNPSLPNQIIAFLEGRQGRNFRAKDIWEGLGKPNIKTLRGALQRLSTSEKIGKHGRGRFRARRVATTSEAAAGANGH